MPDKDWLQTFLVLQSSYADARVTRVLWKAEMASCDKASLDRVAFRGVMKTRRRRYPFIDPPKTTTGFRAGGGGMGRDILWL